MSAAIVVRDVTRHYRRPRTSLRHKGTAVEAVRGVSFEVAGGERFGIVGESGCGKSVTALSIMRLLPRPMGQILAGSVMFDGRDLLQLSLDKMRRVRGGEIGMVFQEPMTALNPVHRVGKQLSEVLQLHGKMTRVGINPRFGRS